MDAEGKNVCQCNGKEFLTICVYPSPMGPQDLSHLAMPRDLGGSGEVDWDAEVGGAEILYGWFTTFVGTVSVRQCLTHSMLLQQNISMLSNVLPI